MTSDLETFAKSRSECPYFIDNSHYYTFVKWCQNEFIKKYAENCGVNNIMNSGGLCFALCLKWASNINAAYQNNKLVEQQMIPGSWDSLSFFMECVGLQMKAKAMCMWELRELLRLNQFRQISSILPIPHVSYLCTSSSRLYHFLSHGTISCISNMLIFMSNNLSSEGHVICLTRLPHLLAIFDPNLGVVSFRYQFCQQQSKAAFDMCKLISNLISGYALEDIFLLEFVSNQTNNSSVK
jgi:hypothetical protein